MTIHLGVGSIRCHMKLNVPPYLHNTKLWNVNDVQAEFVMLQ